MPDVANLQKAVLQQLDADFKDPINKQNWCTVQFNPESLKVSFANQLEPPKGAGDQRGPAARQFVGSSTTKLALTLWFDVGSPQTPPPDGDAPAGQSPQPSAPPVDDVRKLTEKVAFFITPQSEPGKKQKVPPGVRFQWGTFQFDGIMDSLEETIEFFSPEGKPLRSSVALTLSRQDFQYKFPKQDDDKPGGGGAPGAAGKTPGTTPLAQAPAGASVQGLADAAGKGGDWQSIAAANGIENPRALTAGALLDLDLAAPALSAGVQFGGGVELQVVAGASLSANVGGL